MAKVSSEGFGSARAIHLELAQDKMSAAEDVFAEIEWALKHRNCSMANQRLNQARCLRDEVRSELIHARKLGRNRKVQALTRQFELRFAAMYGRVHHNCRTEHKWRR